MLPYSSTSNYQQSKPPASNPLDKEEREALIVEHLPKVKYISDRMSAKLPPTIERDDLYGAGVIGLIDAVERFDPSRGVAFTTFAEMRVRGAILDNLRELDWASRSIRRRAREVQAAYSHIEQEKGRNASEEEVSEFLNIPLVDFHQLLQEISGLTFRSLDEKEETTGLSLMDSVHDEAASPLDNLQEKEIRKRLIHGIDNLPEKERMVMSLYYVQELNMKEIGAVLDISESRVSQLKTQATTRLRAKIEG
jgi:RNA polymerase sigma factor for flagellar operon FliA